ncbi:hypothetical protein OSB04_001937 [Centaurea solstitialis]|uniref:F-box domain-containing protein n=1 Tax=Centaurea solstitialis TaxID=347529 RepID=A0AA38WV48_9ASTR|nr:hypothetical protein OSB04_001937 [Centaurea solstitialis]
MMTSTSAADPSSAMAEETPNWLEMPDEITGIILQRLGAVEILKNAQKVCRNWRRICKDPAMWKVIDIDASDTDYDIEQLTKQAVNRSCGELIDISFDCYGSDDLLDYVSRCSRKLKSLRLTNCDNITITGLTHALKKLPHLETLHLFNISIASYDIELIGQTCPQLKSFMKKSPFIEYGDDALAIANNMPALRHLQLIGCTVPDNCLQAILHGCPHLESLDLRGCFYLLLDGKLEEMCRERIKDFKFIRHNLPTEEYEFSDMDVSVSGSSVISEEDYDDYYFL